jgi:diazepam-binding inhibitor (GABA receptor modulating acyl-CoA-binding protein)
MSELKSAFEAAVEGSRELSQRPDNMTLLKLYGLYKQSTDGDNASPKPGFSDLVGRAKWDAWAALKSTPQEDAMKRYIDLVESLS